MSTDVLRIARTFAKDNQRLSGTPARKAIEAQVLDGPGVTLDEHQQLRRLVDEFAGRMSSGIENSIARMLAQPIAVADAERLSFASASSARKAPGARAILVDGVVPNPSYAPAYAVAKRGGGYVITLGSIQPRPGMMVIQVTQNFQARISLPSGAPPNARVTVCDTTGRTLYSGVL